MCRQGGRKSWVTTQPTGLDLEENPKIEIVWIDKATHTAAMRLLAARADKSYSLCDTVSFVVMRRLSILDALTTVRHFEQEGFNRLLR